MGAIVCIALLVLFVLFVLGRGTGKTIAQTEVAARKAAKATPVITKAAAHKAVEVSSVAKDKASSGAHTGLVKGKAAASVAGGVTSTVARGTASTVVGALRSAREQYRETKEASLNS